MNAWRSATLWKLALRQMRRRPARTALTLLGLVIGVATLVAVSLTTQAVRRAYGSMFEAITGRASLEVVAEGLGNFDPALASAMAAVPGVKAAVPVVQMSAVVVGPAGPVPVLILGVDPAADQAARDYIFETGGRPGSDEGVLLEAGFARAQRLLPGQSARFWGPRGPVNLPIAGLLAAQGAAAFNGGAVAFVPLAVAQRRFLGHNQINAIHIVVDRDTDHDRVAADIRRLLPSGLLVQAPGERGGRIRSALFVVEQSLAGLTMIALIAGAFVILNTFLMNLGERRKQLAILRALGATSGQITQLLLREALLLGTAGTILGWAAGLALTFVFVRAMEQIVGNITFPALRWSKEAIVLAVLFGPGMALAATWLPAWRAGRRVFSQDLFLRRAETAEKLQRRWPVYAGLVLIGLHSILVSGFIGGWVPLSLITPVMGVGAVGCVLAIPLFLAPLETMAGWLLKPLLGLEGRLAFRQLERHRARTALTVGTLAIPLFVGIGFGNTFLASLRDIRQWCAQAAIADGFVRGTVPDGAYSMTLAPLPDSLENELARMPDADRVDKLNFIPIRAQGKPIIVLACTVATGRPLPLTLVEGEPGAVARGLQHGQAVLGTALARILKLAPGDDIEIETRQGPRRIRVAGTANDYTLNGMVLYLEWHTAAPLFQMQGVHVFAVSALPGRSSALARALQTFCAARGLIFQSQADLRGYIDQAVDRLARLFWTLLALVFVVASLGVVNTLTMNILEQTRELGILRAVGLRRRQLMKMILSQALAISAISLGPGILIGALLTYRLHGVNQDGLAHPVHLQFDLGLLVGCVLLSAVIAVVAALVPARRAGRLQIIQAVKYE
jgi:putative ABC transport system permease protein